MAYREDRDLSFLQFCDNLVLSVETRGFLSHFSFLVLLTYSEHKHGLKFFIF
jgi:hypothetical protein